MTAPLNYITLLYGCFILCCFYIQNSWIPQLLMAYNDYICNNPSSFNPPKLNKTGTSWLTAWLTFFRQDTSSQGGRSLEIPRRFGSVQKGRKKEPWKLTLIPTSFSTQWHWECEGVIGIPLDFATQQKNSIKTWRTAKSPWNPWEFLHYENG